MRKTVYIHQCLNPHCSGAQLSEKDKEVLKSSLILFNVVYIPMDQCPSCSSSKTKSNPSISAELQKLTEGLTFKEYKILSLFLQNPNIPMDRDQLINSLWTNVKVGPKTLDVHVFNLRRKIRPKGFDLIHKGGGIWKLEKIQIN